VTFLDFWAELTMYFDAAKKQIKIAPVHQMVHIPLQYKSNQLNYVCHYKENILEAPGLKSVNVQMT
jgi:hypothetical protein